MYFSLSFKFYLETIILKIPFHIDYLFIFKKRNNHLCFHI